MRHPDLIRRLILVGTGPRAGEPPQDPGYAQYGAMTDPQTGQSPIETYLYLFFRPSETSQAAGKMFWARRHIRKEDVDVSTSAQTMAGQRAAITEWRQPRGERFEELKTITQPTLVVNGRRDIMVPTINSFTLSQKIPNAQLIIYPDSGYGSLFQFPELFVTHATTFLDGPVARTGARLHEVFFAIDNLEVAVGIDRGDIARVEPSIGIHGALSGSVTRTHKVTDPYVSLTVKKGLLLVPSFRDLLASDSALLAEFYGA
jgi:hypothetical protein